MTSDRRHTIRPVRQLLPEEGLTALAKARIVAAGVAIAALGTLALQPETLGGFAASRFDHSTAFALLVAITLVALGAAACPRQHFAGFIWGLLVGCLCANALAALFLASAPLGALAYVYAAILVARYAAEVPK